MMPDHWTLGTITAAALLVLAAPGAAQEKSAADFQLSPEQLEHIAENNAGRAEPLNVGDVAPDFELPSLDGTDSTRLAGFRDERPVILFFGSYT